ncbi:MAG: response regulator [Treponema sp.]|jgi:putative two-component system response regulator|nr:response regulator [Treponema sp.]
MKTDKKKIALVDDDLTNLEVGKNILEPVYSVAALDSGRNLFASLEKEKADLILLDIEMPGMNGLEVLKILKAGAAFREIPVIFLTVKDDPGSELEGLSLGAVDYISKPFSPPLLLKRIELHLLLEKRQEELQEYNDHLQEMVREKTRTVLDLQNSVLKNVAACVEFRDEATGEHVEHTLNYLSLLMDEMLETGLYREEISLWDRELTLQSSQLHDVGKIHIRDSILLKPGRLTVEEFEEMKKHTIFGVNIIEKMMRDTPGSSFLEYARIFAGTHHEKWDGSGYPYGLGGRSIPLQGRMMAIADVYDALISPRAYKEPFTHARAVEIIERGKGAQFEPELVDIFMKVEGEFEKLVSLPAC